MYSLSPTIRRVSFWFFVFGSVSIFVLFVSFYLWTKTIANETSSLPHIAEFKPIELTGSSTSAFPVGVDPDEKQIIENPVVDTYIESYLSLNPLHNRKTDYLNRLLAVVVQYDWYQNMASAVSRILVIYPGERKEEVVSNIGKILKWDEEERQKFIELVTTTQPELVEGKFYPGKYVVPIGADPELVANEINNRFIGDVLNRYDESVTEAVPLKDALVIASLLEREAYDFTDMRYISGIIWNRLFINMPLQLDATLQYAKGSKLSERLWWPKPVPADKYLKSPYNTYQNSGLPPTPIANPSVASVVAALNPKVTDCMFYFHGPKGQFYCTKTYEEHVAKLKEIYGQGK